MRTPFGGGASEAGNLELSGQSVRIKARPASRPPGARLRKQREHDRPGEQGKHRIANGLTQGSYNDPDGREGYWYKVQARCLGVVTAVNASGESGPSNEARAERKSRGDSLGGDLIAGLEGGGGGDDCPPGCWYDYMLGECVCPPPPPPQPVVRKFYHLGSQRIALRISGDPDPARNGLFFFHVDHPSAALRTGLGSTSLLSLDFARDAAQSTITGTLAAGSEARFLPYGEYRVEPQAELTDQGFTGHKQNNDIELVDMEARWYSPQIGRFVSPDTILPDPSNPQNLNRYSYVVGNPLKYVDPNGNCVKPPPLLQMSDTLVDRLRMWSPFAGGVVAEPRSPAPTSSDLTDWLIEQMVTNATQGASILREDYRSLNPVEVTAAIQAWTSLVRTGGAWDYKSDILDSGQVFGDEKLIVLGGREISYQAAANIHFGFVGRAATFESGFLQLGAGLAQIADHGLVLENVQYFGDEAFDNWCIRFGAYLYDLYGGRRLDELTPEAFSEALDDFFAENGEPPDL